MAEGGSFQDVDKAFDNINKNNISTPMRVVSPEFVPEAVKLLQKILSTIVAKPSEPKFRSLKKTNKQVADKILPCRGALQLLTACGFRSADGVLTMTDERVELPRLQYAIAQLEAMGPAREAAAAAKIQAAEAARAELYKQQQSDQREDKRIKLLERRKLDEQRADYERRLIVHPIAGGPVAGWSGAHDESVTAKVIAAGQGGDSADSMDESSSDDDDDDDDDEDAEENPSMRLGDSTSAADTPGFPAGVATPQDQESDMCDGSWAHIRRYAEDELGSLGRKPTRSATAEADHTAYGEYLQSQGLSDHDYVLTQAAWPPSCPDSALEPSVAPNQTADGISHWVLWRHPDHLPADIELDPDMELEQLQQLLAAESEGVTPVSVRAEEVIMYQDLPEHRTVPTIAHVSTSPSVLCIWRASGSAFCQSCCCTTPRWAPVTYLTLR
jgi:hypothetical protein